MVNATAQALGGLSSRINGHARHAITTSASSNRLTRDVISVDHVDCARITLRGVVFDGV